MEPIRTTIDERTINSMYSDIMNSTRVLSIPLIRCDYQVFKYNEIKKRENIDNKVFNGMIKEEIIDEADHHNDYRQTIQKGVKCEFDEEINTIDTVIKNEMDLNDGSVFKGSFNNEWHSSELISQINSDKTAHFNSKALLKRNSKTPTRKRRKRVKCEFDEEINTIDTVIKNEMDLNNGSVFKGSFNNKWHSSELISQINSDKTAHLNSKALLKRNSKTPTRKRRKRLICDNCKKWFYTKTDLLTHISDCTRGNIYKSDISDKRFSQARDLKKNIRPHTELKSYKCYVCDRGFSLSGNLKSHMRTHTGEKPFACDLCDKKFYRKRDLKRHTRIHTGEKPYKCDVCNREFFDAPTLKVHMRTHTGDKPYACDLCDKRFNKTGDLKRHTRTHTGEKPYKCDVCHREFSLAANLKIHMRTHTKDKPYKCDFCEKLFSFTGNFKRHERTHT